jgi:hypothetical protein
MTVTPLAENFGLLMRYKSMLWIYKIGISRTVLNYEIGE